LQKHNENKCPNNLLGKAICEIYTPYTRNSGCLSVSEKSN